MQLICPYSGESYFLSEVFLDDKMHGPHPLFNYPAAELLKKARAWSDGKLSEKEEKLLFLALLNKTEAVKFSTYADPSPSIVAQNMESMFRLISWFSELSPGTIEFPQYRINETNYQLQNVGQFISAWYEVRAEWSQPSSRRALQEQLEANEHAITKMIHSGKTPEQMASRLASWAMKAVKVPADMKNIWTELFKISGDDIYKVDAEVLLEMKTFFDVNLMLQGSHAQGAGHTFSVLTLQHLNMLYQTAKEGHLASLTGGETFTLLDDDGQVTEKKHSIEHTNVRLLALKAPDIEPQLTDYSSRIDYIRAKAAWRMAQVIAEGTERISDTPTEQPTKSADTIQTIRV